MQPAMKILTIIVRILLGLVFVFFGSNAFFHFLPAPPPTHSLAGDYMNVLTASGYIYVIAVFQVVAGLLLLIGVFVPLALTVLAAIIVNILAFHALMAPASIGPGIVVTVLELFLLWRYRGRFADLFRGLD